MAWSLKKSTFVAFGLAAATLPIPLHAQAVVSNGNVSLGVDSRGQLNAGGVGVLDNRTGLEGTLDGCDCEGWGAADAATGTTGYANNSTGIANTSLVSFSSTSSTATSIVNILGARPMQVTHDFMPSVSADLFRVVVSIRNIGDAVIDDLRYRRVMDWDIQPTAFSELVTIQGVGASALLFSSDNGFANADPLSARGSILAGTVNMNFIDSGPADHGALFDFGFGALGAGETKTFDIFYGASLSEADALTALGAVGAEVYSLGQSAGDASGTTPGRSTFIFGFRGVGGTAIGAVPEPSTWAMMLLGFFGIGAAMRNRRSRLGQFSPAIS